jgi:hypothetical protein
MPNDNADLTTQDTQEPSLRETLAANLAATVNESTDEQATNNAENLTSAGDKAMPSVDTNETAEQRADRLRDEKGRFAPGKNEGEQKPVIQQADATQQQPAAKAMQPPSTWNAQEKIAFQSAPPEIQQAILRREANYAQGVSTYKQEYDRVKPIADAMEPLLPILQQFGREPGEWIQTMGTVHHLFQTGTPQQKVQAILKVMQDYNVPLGDYIAQGGQLPQFNPNHQMQQRQAPLPAHQDVRQLVQAELQMHQSTQAVKSFTEAKDAQGNPKYPHYETVKQDMVGLLQAGLAQDLEGAYAKAVRMHDDISQQDAAAKAQADAAEKAAAAQAKVNRARRNTVSIASSTPSSGKPDGDKGLRETLTENFRAVAGGRV